MQLDVVNNENKKVGSRRRQRRGVRRTRQHRSDVGVGRARQRGGAPRHARDEEPRARQRQRQEAVAAEGHRPRAASARAGRRCGATAARCFGPQPRSYDFKLPKKVERGALRAALAEKLKTGDARRRRRAGRDRDQDQGGGRAAEAARRHRQGGPGRRRRSTRSCRASVRNIPGVSLVPSARLTARDVIDAGRVVATQGALEKLQEVLA